MACHILYGIQETVGCIPSTVAMDALVLKHQAISTHITYFIYILLEQFTTNVSQLWYTVLQN